MWEGKIKFKLVVYGRLEVEKQKGSGRSNENKLAVLQDGDVLMKGMCCWVYREVTLTLGEKESKRLCWEVSSARRVSVIMSVADFPTLKWCGIGWEANCNKPHWSVLLWFLKRIKAVDSLDTGSFWFVFWNKKEIMDHTLCMFHFVFW